MGATTAWSSGSMTEASPRSSSSTTTCSDTTVRRRKDGVRLGMEAAPLILVPDRMRPRCSVHFDHLALVGAGRAPRRPQRWLSRRYTHGNAVCLRGRCRRWTSRSGSASDQRRPLLFSSMSEEKNAIQEGSRSSCLNLTRATETRDQELSMSDASSAGELVAQTKASLENLDAPKLAETLSALVAAEPVRWRQLLLLAGLFPEPSPQKAKEKVGLLPKTLSCLMEAIQLLLRSDVDHLETSVQIILTLQGFLVLRAYYGDIIDELNKLAFVKSPPE